jgi:HD-GYP domain-containing protein (c-di-GMP phosphodiesterase class II)
VGPQRALSIIKSAAGHQFDPELVEALVKVAE